MATTRAKRGFWMALFTIVLMLLIMAGSLVFRREPGPFYLGQPISYWVSQVKARPPESVNAAKAIRFFGTNALPFLISELSLEHTPERRFWENKLRTVPRLRAKLGYDNNRRERAVHALGILGPAAAPAVPQLIALIPKEDPIVFKTLVALGDTGVPGVTNALLHPSGRVRILMMVALGAPGLNLAPDERRTVFAALLANARETNYAGKVAVHALNALGRVGGFSEMVWPVLKGIIEDKQQPEPVVYAAVNALVYCYDRVEASIVPALIARFQGASEQLRSSILMALGDSFLGHDEILPTVIEGLGDSDLKVRTVAQAVFARIPGDTSQGVPELTKLLNHREAVIRVTAADALGKYGSNAGSAIPALKAALEDSDDSVRSSATNALMRIE